MAQLVSMKHFALTLANNNSFCFPPNLVNLECTGLRGLLKASNKVGSSKLQEYGAVGLSTLQTETHPLSLSVPNLLWKLEGNPELQTKVI